MDGIKPHKHMAGMSGSKEGVSGDFGVKPFHEVNGGSPMPSHGHEAMGDGERAIGSHVERGKGMMPAQRHPDHGPHGHVPEDSGSFGVPSFKSVNG